MSAPQLQKTQRSLPPKGHAAEELLELMAGYKKQDEARWKGGQLSGAVYHGEDDHLDLLNAAAGMFSVSNPLHSSTWPSVNKFEAEIIAMTASLLNGGDEGVCGCMTSGGTESILMAAKTHRQWAEREKGITAPEVICAGSAHAAIYKAADILRLKIVEVPIGELTCEMDVAATRAAITPNTILIYSSAPNYPQGIIDPISELSEIALEHNVGLHVDCCLGGFVLPFARKLRNNIPDFDFTLPGVTSMSADTHKYGYATKGTSVVLYRSKELRKHQFFTFPKWQGGNYGTPSTAGSRPGTLSAAAWASMMRLGEEGYLEATERLLSTTEKLTAAFHRIDGIHAMGSPKAMVTAFGADEGASFNVYQVAGSLNKRGYHFASCQFPPCVHLAVTLRHADVIDEIITALEEAVAEAKATPEPEGMKSGVAIYGEADVRQAEQSAESLLKWMANTLDLPPEGFYEKQAARAAAKAAAEVVTAEGSSGRSRSRL